MEREKRKGESNVEGDGGTHSEREGLIPLYTCTHYNRYCVFVSLCEKKVLCSFCSQAFPVVRNCVRV